MKEANIALSLAALAFGAAACGGSDVRMRPEIPSDVTTTTAASTPGTARASAAKPQRVEITQPSPSFDTDVGATPIDKRGSLAAGPTPKSPSAWDDASRKAQHAEPGFTDRDILAVLDAADRVERQYAREALKRTQSARLRQLAQRVLSDHGEAKLERVERRATLIPADNTTSMELKSSGAHNVQAMQSASDKDFDQALIDALAGEERQLIQLLDDKLIPQAQNGDLRTLLQDVRTSVSSRLAAASEIQSARAR
jgi:putative membrane protein